MTGQARGERNPVQDGATIMEACEVLAGISADTERLVRRYLSPEHARANAMIASWMAAVGMRTWQDSVGNQWGRYEGEDPEAPALVLGSHLDAGGDNDRFDGVLGILLGIAVVTRLNAQGKRPARPIEVVAFGDGLGKRFGNALFTSRAMAGEKMPDPWQSIDNDGITLAQALHDFGLDPARVSEAARDPASLAGYLEVHTEQGPVLEAERQSLGVGTGIMGERCFAITLCGQAGHAGTTPFELRRDALTGAAEAILAIETLARAAGVVATVGHLATHPGVSDTIVGQIHMSLDIRAEHDEDRDRTLEAIRTTCDSIGETRGLAWQWEELRHIPAKRCAPRLLDALTAAVSSEQHSAFQLSGGIDCDARAVAAVTDIGLLFVRCRGFIGERVSESVHVEDIDAALNALSETVARLDRETATPV
ncbi:Zn-dependent hydrolase [Kushneria phosphatilytica]|uniref:Zn-dependent hydrolase n=1 Tax=Kushneria phosphatilytica TaxID=657387 RepID=A0A1S1NSF5_9GAMM|nr:Zn-dependent hydrolase [Kushneria phosphatilytica]OHV08408.1 hypothetical protein BH688_13970 [Kushneria phosphatilytica]QEL09834.1 Zn-dependent hydrolase [Kushneria phosphatilytica]